MTNLQLIIVCVTAVALTVIVTQTTGSRPPRWRRSTLAIDAQIGRLVVFHLIGEEASLRGVLVEAEPDAFVLARAEHISPRATIALDGLQMIARHRLDFFQVLDQPAPKGTRALASVAVGER